MKTEVMVKVPSIVEIKPGDKVVVDYNLSFVHQKELTVYKVVETACGVHVVFTNGTWRPMTTYNDTWKKREWF